ncbi:hypothetical protein BDV35DRAFT_334980 [Aspergillus flavus]|uniref:Uncharacterized protein n=1 Tax=Aspergillus flavus TaxID=5059 RepID=A0A5N6HJL0_ASPFL|nr:hypothetical protein BDV35DRAFT_334980 [Aspergillus flavus]
MSLTAFEHSGSNSSNTQPNPSYDQILLITSPRYTLTSTLNEEMCVDYQAITIHSEGCRNSECNKAELIPGPDCPEKPATGPRNACPKYEVRHSGSSRVKGKCPKHRAPIHLPRFV